jgi:hypothetical protein
MYNITKARRADPDSFNRHRIGGLRRPAGDRVGAPTRRDRFAAGSRASPSPLKLLRR